jgi:hypothetical protein
MEKKYFNSLFIPKNGHLYGVMLLCAKQGVELGHRAPVGGPLDGHRHVAGADFQGFHRFGGGGGGVGPA